MQACRLMVVLAPQRGLTCQLCGAAPLHALMDCSHAYPPWLAAAVASGDPSARAAAETGLRQMSAGEVFSPEDSQHPPSEAA